MAAPIVILATSADLPNLDADEAGLPDALRERGMEPRIEVWNDPSVDWGAADLTVVRSVRDYATDRDGFLAWANSVPRLLNQASLMEWNSDKHYLAELGERGLPVIPTTWLEPDREFSKHQIHTRFPAHGDFVVKPAVSSGGRGTGRYTATDPRSRAEAIKHASHEMRQGRSVMVQRYLSEIDRSGELSIVYLNGLPAYSVEKKAMLHPRFRSVDEVQDETVVESTPASEKEFRWGEQIRSVLHDYISDKSGRDELLLYNRVDIVRGGENSDSEFYVMEISLMDGSLYLSADPENLRKFADAIAVRAFW
ncbi:MAG: glutathione synthetase [Ancrocorticia sp.]|nr:glutathione synthetase [Ancrocorticia sp.]